MYIVYIRERYYSSLVCRLKKANKVDTLLLITKYGVTILATNYLFDGRYTDHLPSRAYEPNKNASTGSKMDQGGRGSIKILGFTIVERSIL